MEDATNKVEYCIRDLPTRSVTLFPSRAQVIREIKDVPLKPGSNEVIVVGLSPTVDEHSIKVEGTGSHAIITDIAVELLPNHELFQDIYPDSEDEDNAEEEREDKETTESDEDESCKEQKKIVEDSLDTLGEKLLKLRDDQHCAKEAIANASTRLKLLDAFGDSLKDKECKIPIADGLATYQRERENVFADHMEATLRERTVAKEIAGLIKEEARLLQTRRKQQDKLEKSRRKAREVKRKELAKEGLRKAGKQKQKDRIRKEREQFWPRSCYTVRITLDSAVFTPTSSRRTSIASASDLLKPTPEKEASDASHDDNVTCDISLTYVTTSAFWSPSYDLSLSTTSNSARLCFDASLTNMTSEAWNNCKIILSNLQTTFSTQNDVIPTLKPWHLKLGGKNAFIAPDVLHSKEERAQQIGWAAAQNALVMKPRAEMFGTSNNSKSNNNLFGKNAPVAHAQKNAAPFENAPRNPAGGFGFGQAQSAAASTFGPMQSNLFGGASAPGPSAFGTSSGAVSGGLFGSASSNRVPPNNAPIDAALNNMGGGGLFGSSSGNHVPPSDDTPNDVAPNNGGGTWEYGDDGATILEPTPELAFQESSFEETGLTTTYDLPGLKTLKPSSTTSKQRVAHLSFANVIFSRTVVAKYKPIAYLKAKLRNSSKVTLLKGPTGLSLDGTFMGRSTLPRCSAGDSFVLSLGIDPAIRVSYPKPDVKRSTSGLFSKEDSSVYTRTITLLNTRAASGKHVNITVLDQVPVSEDEKLRVNTLHPRGMSVNGTAVATGAAAREGENREGEKDWGVATAALKKGGEVSWDVRLNAGRSVKLLLEYEIVFPAGEHVTQC